MKQYKIVVAGTGYVGLVAGVCFAEKGHQVTCVDVDERKRWLMKSGFRQFTNRSGRMMQRNLQEGRLDFTTDYQWRKKGGCHFHRC